MSRTAFGGVIGIASLSIASSLMIDAFTYSKVFLLLTSIILIYTIFAFPEFGLALAFSSGLFKEWLSINVPFFAKFDFTIGIFLLASVSVLFMLLKRGTILSLRYHRSYLPLFLFTAYMIISVLRTPSFNYGSLKSFSFMFFNWGLFLLPAFVITEEKYAQRLIVFLIILGSAICLVTLSSLTYGLLAHQLLTRFRISFLGINPISFANWVGAINVLLIVIAICGQRNKYTALVVLGIILMTLTMLIANSRGPLIGFIATILLIFSSRLVKISKKRLALWIVVAVILIAIAIAAFLPSQLTDRYASMIIQEPGSSNLALSSVNTRLYAWRAAFQLATDNVMDFWFGIGIGGFSQIFYGQDLRLYPHNIFLEVFCELGIVGLFFLVWHFVSVFVMVGEANIKTSSGELKLLTFAFLMAVVFNLVCAQFSGDLNDNRRLWFFLGTLVAMQNLIYKKQSN